MADAAIATDSLQLSASSSSTSSDATFSTSPKTAATVVPPHGTSYHNKQYHFSLTYPSDLSVDQYDEGHGTKSIAFQKGDEPLGFQMFITPDPDEPITLAQVKADFSTLAMQDIETVTIGTGTPALAFSSNTPDLGPTRELWFVHDGYLFEITTYSNLGGWLRQIIDTIRFP